MLVSLPKGSFVLISTMVTRLIKPLSVCILAIFLAACDGKGASGYSRDGLVLDLPENWEVFEDVELNDQHRSVNLVTSRGSMVGLEILRLQSGELGVDINAYLKRYVSSAVPNDAIREKASFDFGERVRSGVTGKFVHVSTPKPTDTHFMIEVYQLVNNENSTFVVFNTPDSEVESLQNDFDRFLSAVAKQNK